MEVQIYFIQKGFEKEDAETFFKEFKKRQWLNKKGKSLMNWRAKASERMWVKQKDNPYLRSKAKLLFNR
ncbi:MAG TPA: hypothetical protein VL125_04870 [Pelobium sp.]|nr:hypothetical protein [Pelobium sp.]